MIQISYDYETCHNVCVCIYIYISKQSIFLIHPKNRWNIVQPKTKRIQDTINYAIHTGAKQSNIIEVSCNSYQSKSHHNIPHNIARRSLRPFNQYLTKLTQT